MKVAILESLGISHEELMSLKAPFVKEGVEFVEYQKTLDVEELKAETAGAEAVIIANMPYPSSVIASSDKLKFIDVAFTGTDHVGLDAAREKGISVSNASGYSNEAVSELVLGMVLSFMRNITQVEARCREGKDKTGLVGCEIKGKTVGIIGLGKIGKRTAEIFNSLGATVIEKHFTLDKNMPGWDHKVSANPEEMRIIASESKRIVDSLGNGIKVVSDDEIAKQKKFRRTIATVKPLKAGQEITYNDIAFKRPGTGIPADRYKEIIGRHVCRDIEADKTLFWEDLVK